MHLPCTVKNLEDQDPHVSPSASLIQTGRLNTVSEQANKCVVDATETGTLNMNLSVMDVLFRVGHRKLVCPLVLFLGRNEYFPRRTFLALQFLCSQSK